VIPSLPHLPQPFPRLSTTASRRREPGAPPRGVCSRHARRIKSLKVLSTIAANFGSVYAPHYLFIVRHTHRWRACAIAVVHGRIDVAAADGAGDAAAPKIVARAARFRGSERNAARCADASAAWRNGEAYETLRSKAKGYGQRLSDRRRW